MREEDALKATRDEIDTIDAELLRLINARARCAIEIGRIKKAGGATTSLYRAEREAEVLRRVRDSNPGPLPMDDAVRIVREIMSACLALEQPLRVAYFGPAGTYTHAAAQRHFGSAVNFLPRAAIDEVVRDVEAGSAEFGVVPIENSLEGPVNLSHDLLYASNLTVCGEVVLPIHHQLLSKARNPRELKRVYAHSQALAQCRHWLDSQCPQAERVAASSNAEAARLVAEQPEAAAIAGMIAAELYGLPVLAANIEDRADNTTRFPGSRHGVDSADRRRRDLPGFQHPQPRRCPVRCVARVRRCPHQHEPVAVATDATGHLGLPVLRRHRRASARRERRAGVARSARADLHVPHPRLVSTGRAVSGAPR